MSLKEYLSGKKILVTGGGRGIGRSLCVRLHEYGAIVFALSKTKENLESLEKECPGITTICVDLADWSATRTEISRLDRLDGLINNAALFQNEEFLEISSDNLDRLFNVNVKAVINVSQVVAQKMIEAGTGGSIVNVSTAASKRAFPKSPVYCITKAALDMVTRSMVIALGPHKIRVNSIHPACTKTDMLTTMLEGWTPEMIKTNTERSPLRDLNIPMDDVVNTTLFLLSGMATMMTGEMVAVDGGILTG